DGDEAPGLDDLIDAPAVENAPADELPAKENADEVPGLDDLIDTPAAEDAPADELPAKENADEAPELDDLIDTPAAENAPADELPAKENADEVPGLDDLIDAPEVENAPADELPAKENADEVPGLDDLIDAPKAGDTAEEAALQDQAVEQVLEANDDAELAPILRKVKPEEIRETVDKALEEVEVDNKSEEINGIVSDSLKEVDEDAIEASVDQVLADTETALSSKNEGTAAVSQEETDLALPESVDQVLEEADIEVPEETPAEEPAEEVPVSEESAEAEISAGGVPARMVKLAELDSILALPENADFEALVQYTNDLDRIRPSDLNVEDPAVQEAQINEFLQKLFIARLRAAEAMTALEGLTDEQWETAVSLKVQTLANLFRVDETHLETLRKFRDEIQPRADQELLWNVEAVLIQMELCSFREEPAPEVLKSHVKTLLAHTRKGLELGCLNPDFALTTVQMVLLSEEKLPKEESSTLFAEAIEILNSSEEQNLKDTATLLENILKQREIQGNAFDFEVTAQDGKVLKAGDFAGKDLLLYCCSFQSQEQIADLGLIYQIYMAYHSKGLEVIGLVSGPKTDDMDALLKQIPWPMVFEDPKDENAIRNRLAVTILPAKILISPEGKVVDPNITLSGLMQHLEKAYGPVESSETEETEGTAEAETEEEAPAAETETAEEVSADTLGTDTLGIDALPVDTAVEE
ncbi:MAG: hypothetical protein J6J31_04890, partial [Thermoguttaceae bacterium]|nr:hypothetical protein [Thermoguttaceae bacterium]